MIFGRTRALVAALAVVIVASVPAGAGAAIVPTTRVSLFALASSDGRYESSGLPGWVADDGQSLAMVGDAPRAESGMRFDIKGSPLARTDSVSAASITSGAPVPGVHKWGVLATRRLTVVPVQWASAAWKQSDKDNAVANIAQIVPWWNAMSARQETLAVKLTEAVDVSSKVAAQSCDIQGMAEVARDYLDSKGLDATTDHLMMVFTPDTKECGFAGLGEVGGTTTWAYASPGYSGVWVHELGHNLGFPHANVCNAGVTLSYMTNCTDVEYGNNADVMGSSTISSFYSPSFLVDAGFLPAANTSVFAGTSMTVTLQRADRSDLGTTAVRIPAAHPELGDNTFWLQYNPNRIGAVPQSATPTNGGVAITMEPSSDFASNVITADGITGKSNSTSYLCDLTPPTTSLDARDTTTDPRLSAGSSWTDPRDRFTVTLVSADGTAAVVRIDPVASPSVWASSTVASTNDPNGLTNLTVTWTPSLLNIGSHEPAMWSVDTVEDSSKSCTSSVFLLSCTLTGLSRSAAYTPRVSGTNVNARSSYSVSGSTSVPVSPPTFTATFTSTDTSLTAVVTTGDGGGTVTGTPTLTLGDLPPCALAVNAATTCTFDGLGRRASHVLVARGTNQAGSREKSFTAATLAGVPETPELSGSLSGTDLVMEVAPSVIDQANVDYYYVQCTIGAKSWSKLAPADLEHRASGVFKVPAVKGKATWCYSALVSMGATKQFTSDFGSVKVDAKGKVTAGKLSLSALADDARKGLINMKWTAKDSLGKAITVDVRSSKKSCAKKSALSCVVAGLPSGSVVVIRVTARGQSGSRSIWKTVVVK